MIINKIYYLLLTFNLTKHFKLPKNEIQMNLYTVKLDF